MANFRESEGRKATGPKDKKVYGSQSPFNYFYARKRK